MTINFSNGLAALSMLSGTNGFADFAAATAATPPADTLAVRKAKAQFTLAATTPPWKQPTTSTPVSAQVSAIKQLKSIIDTSVTTPNAGSADVQTAFTTYKALDKLQVLATAAAKTTTSDAERTSLQAAFVKGLTDLQTYLAEAPTDKVKLSFANPTSRAATVALAASDPLKFTGTGMLDAVDAVGNTIDARDTALPGLTGAEKLRITLTKPGASDTIDIDLAQTKQPPTLDSVSDAINTAIEAIPLRNPDGTVVVDADGNTKPRWLVHFLPDKTSGKWGFGVQAPNGAEQVSIDQIGAADALIVATGRTAANAPSVTQIMRIDDVTGSMDSVTEGKIASVDSAATARAKLTPPVAVKGVTAAPVTVYATTTTQAITSDSAGFSYAVGTASGDLGANKSNGSSDMYLTKLNSQGTVVWQRSLGAAGTAQGAAISVGANGDITVAGTVSGSFTSPGTYTSTVDGSVTSTYSTSTTDGDMLVARYNAQGDESFATVVRSVGVDAARALAVGTDGSIYVGGKTAANGGDAVISRLDATGKFQESRTIAGSTSSESITALAIGQDGNLLALTNESGTATLRRISATNLNTDVSSISLGQVDARALAVSSDGTIAVAGATSTALPGAQVNTVGTGRDGFVTRIDAGLAGASTTYLATAGDDQIDSVTFMSGALYVGGRTTGDLDGTRVGKVDGFVSRLDATTGAVQDTTQFGRADLTTEPVRIAAATGSDSVLTALGLHRGPLNPPQSVKLVAQTSLRAGDEFSISVAGGAAKKVVIKADDTLQTLGDRILLLTGSKAKVTSTNVNGAITLSIAATAGSSISLVAGATGKDALAKLGLDPARLSVPITRAKGAPKVQPGGSYGLSLTESLNLSTAKDASATLNTLKNAISTTQSAYRSLYWDAGKAALINGGTGASTALTAAQSAQLDNYKAALARLTSVADTSSSTSLTGFL